MSKKWIYAALATLSLAASAQSASFFGFNIDNVLALIDQSEKKLNAQQCHMVGQGTMIAMARSPKAYRKMLELAEQRMGNPLDSLYNEDVFAGILHHAVDSFILSPSEKIRPQLLLDNVKKNHVGTTAADFAFVTPDGAKHRLNDYLDGYVLLYFNDPECESCAAHKERMAQSAIIKQLTDENRLHVVGIYTGTDKKQWRKAAAPSFMVNGRNEDQRIESNDLYVLPTLPLYYLIAPDGTVLMKNVTSLNRIERALDKLANTEETEPDALVNLLYNLR